MKLNINKLFNFYNGRPVYITGITSDLGTWLAITLKMMGANVHGCGLFSQPQSLYDSVELSKHVPISLCDITSSADKSKYMLDLIDVAPDVVFNLASQSNEEISNEFPFDTFNTNVMGYVITNEILRGLQHHISLLNVIQKPTKSNAYSSSINCFYEVLKSYKQISHNITASTLAIDKVLTPSNTTIDNLIQNNQSLNEINYEYATDTVMNLLTFAMTQYKDKKSHNYCQIPNNMDKNEILCLLNRYTDFNFKEVKSYKTKETVNETTNEQDEFINFPSAGKNNEDFLISLISWYNFHIKEEKMYSYTCDKIKSELSMLRKNN